MTFEQLCNQLEGYYGEELSEDYRKVMDDYLDGKSEMFLGAVFNVLVRRFSRVYGKAPGVSEIEDNLREIRDTMPFPIALPERPQELTSEEYAENARMMREFLEMLGGTARWADG
jgi:hypothetical protein